jgi:serine/threonine protein kinase/tetratricopeptide (TPR) repeat protein
MTEQASEQSIFLHAIGLPSSGDRAAFLDVACRDNPALRKELDALLSAHDRLGGLSPTTGHDSAGDSAAEGAELVRGSGSQEDIGAVVSGRYKLLEQIGEGGMGSVWMAQQTEPVKRLVALKVIKPGMDSKQVLARFEAERQALALMEHPNIARVLDAGTTAGGRPYFVMELVKGVPITRYCDEHRRTPRERLELFLPVCQAIQHAHQKGIIHRDIKPSNVLIASYDGKPMPKVIDFGIAKAAGQQLTERTLVTGFGAIVGTLEYMSPEQAEINALDIDTRSDIYSLGVLLYELLTGTTPLSRKRLSEVAMLEVLRLIREEEPPKPSTRLSEAKDTLPSISAQRQMEPAKLTKLVRGELDWIVMKALEKDRNRRYETANGFALDVQRYLADEPVLACPPSVAYRLRKFVRRNKGPVLAGTLLLLALLLGMVGTTVGLVRTLAAEQRAVRERDEKEEARRQTRQALNTLTDEVMEDLLGRQVQLTDRHREFLKKVLAQHEALATAKADDPEGRQGQAEGYFLVGLIRHRLGQTKEAEAAYRDAVAIQKTLSDEDPNRPEFRYDLALSYNNLATLLRDTGRPEEAEIASRTGLALRQQLVADFPDRPSYRHELAGSHINLGHLLNDTGRPKEAETAYREAMAIGKQLATEFPRQHQFGQDLAISHNNLAVLLYQTGRPNEAETAWRDAVAIRKKLAADFPTVPDLQHDLATVFMNLGNLLRDTNKPNEAEEAYRSALNITKQLAADFPNRPVFRHGLALSQYNFAILMQKTGRPKEAEAAARDALALQKQLAADFPNRTDFRRSLAKTCTVLGILWHDTGRPKEAGPALRDAVALQKKLAADFPNQPEFRQDLALSQVQRGTLLRDLGQTAEAEAAYNDALALQKKLVSEFPNRSDYRSELAGSYYSLAILLHKTYRPREAEAAWRSALTLRKQLAVDFPMVPSHQHDQAVTLTSLATLLRVTRRPEEAEQAYREALAIGKRLTAEFPNLPDFREGLALTLNNLGVLMSHLRRQKEAESAYRDAVAHWKQLVNDLPNRPFVRQELARSHSNLGVVLAATGRSKEAESTYNDALTLWKQLTDEFPNRPDFRQEQARAHDNLSSLLRNSRRPKEAESAWRNALALRKQLVADFPMVPDFHNELAGTLVNLAGMHKQRREFAAAVSLLEEARPHHQAALMANPNNPAYRGFYRKNLSVLAESLLELADHARLATTADNLARFGFQPATDTYNAACFLCHCVTLAEKDDKLAEARRKQLASSYADRALTLLRQAVANGYKDAAHMREDPDLKPLRGREEFQKLLAQLDGNPKE